MARIWEILLSLFIVCAGVPATSGNTECSIGQEAISRANVLSDTGIALVFVDNVILCDGVITSWQFWPKLPFNFKTMALRPLTEDSTSSSSWTIIGTNNIPTSDVVPNQKITYIVPAGDRIGVQSGDVIGIAQYDNNPSIAAKADATGTHLHVAVNSRTSRLLTNTEIFNLQAGSTINTARALSSRGTHTPVAVSVSANVEPGCSVGQRAITRQGELANVRIVTVLVDNTILCNGVIVAWQFWPKRAKSFKAIIFRQVSAGDPTSKWDIIGMNEIPALGVLVYQKNTYTLPIDERIEVQSGDVIGIAQYDEGPALAAGSTDEANSGTSLQVAVNAGTSNVLTNLEIRALDVGDTITTSSNTAIYESGAPPLQVSLSAEVVMQPDPKIGSVRFSQSSYTVSEGTGRISVTLEADSSITPTIVEIQTANSRGTAQASSDYTPVNSTKIEFGSTETSKSFAISILDDGDIENDETFVVAIVSSTSGAISEPRETTITITDDDGDDDDAGCSIGHEVVDRTGVFSHHKLVAVLQDNVIPCDGFVTKWEFWPQQYASFKAMVFRETESGNTAMWTIVGINTISTIYMDKNKKSTYIVPDYERIAVEVGDVIGIAQNDDNPLLQSDQSDSGTTLYVGIDIMTSYILSESDIFHLSPGDVINTVPIGSLDGGERQKVSFSAQVEPASSGSNGISHVSYQSWMAMALFISCLGYLYF